MFGKIHIMFIIFPIRAKLEDLRISVFNTQAVTRIIKIILLSWSPHFPQCRTEIKLQLLDSRAYRRYHAKTIKLSFQVLTYIQFLTYSWLVHIMPCSKPHFSTLKASIKSFLWRNYQSFHVLGRIDHCCFYNK